MEQMETESRRLLEKLLGGRLVNLEIRLERTEAENRALRGRLEQLEAEAKNRALRAGEAGAAGSGGVPGRYRTLLLTNDGILINLERS